MCVSSEEQSILDDFESWAFNTPAEKKTGPEKIIKYLNSSALSDNFKHELNAMAKQCIQVWINASINHIPPVDLPLLEEIINLTESDKKK